MNTPRGKLRDKILSSTIGITGILRPYWKQKTLEDQHWALIKGYLLKIENACKEYCDGLGKDQPL